MLAIPLDTPRQGVPGLTCVVWKIFDHLAALGDGGLLQDLPDLCDMWRCSLKLQAAVNSLVTNYLPLRRSDSKGSAKEPSTLLEEPVLL